MICIAAIVLNAYGQERNCHDLITITIIYASQGCSCCIKSIAILHLTLDVCKAHFTRY